MTDIGSPAALPVTPERPVLIAVMGLTGSGKSTFISHCTEAVVPVGNQLQSHTQDVTPYRYKFAPEANVYLIDTPGFDDTVRDDTDVLRDIAEWLTRVYEEGTKLRGAIYLHRITDIRMQGSAVKNLFMFKKLCGPAGLKNVILATTMWENVLEEDGHRREAELRETPEYWKDMIEKHGSRMVRHQNNSASAQMIVGNLLDSTKPTTFAIQNEMVDEGKDLDQTSAGRELSSIQVEERLRFERQLNDLRKDMAEARELQDKESQEQIRRLQEEKNVEISKLQMQQERMQISLKRLHEERDKELKQLIAIQGSMIEELRQQLTTFSVAGQDLGQKAPSSSLSLRNIDAARNTSPVEYRSGQSPLITEITFDAPGYKGAHLSLCDKYIHLYVSGHKYDISPQHHYEKIHYGKALTIHVSMRPHSSWVRIYYDSDTGKMEILYPESLGMTHPSLYEYLESDKHRTDRGTNIFSITLGPNGWYCIQDLQICRVVGPPTMMALSDITKAWFGDGESWIAATTHKFEWNLMGRYTDLEKLLSSADSNFLRRIFDIALDTGGNEWILLLEDQPYYSDGIQPSIKEWMECAMGKKTFPPSRD